MAWLTVFGAPKRKAPEDDLNPDQPPTKILKSSLEATASAVELPDAPPIIPIDVLSARNFKLERENSKLHLQVDTLKHEDMNTTSKNKELRTSNTTLKNEITFLKTQLAQAKTRNAHSDGAFESIKEDVETLRGQVRALTQEAAGLHGEKADLKAKLENSQARVVDLEEQVDMKVRYLEDRNSCTEERNKELELKNEKLSKEIAFARRMDGSGGNQGKVVSGRESTGSEELEGDTRTGVSLDDDDDDEDELVVEDSFGKDLDEDTLDDIVVLPKGEYNYNLGAAVEKLERELRDQQTV